MLCGLSHFIPTPWLAVAWFALGAATACGSTSSSSSTTEGPGGAPSCPKSKPSKGDERPYATPLTGTIVGRDVNEEACTASVYLAQSHFTVPRDRYLLTLDGVTSGFAIGPHSQGESPGMLQGLIGIPSPAPGVYESSDARSCGGLLFSYTLPEPPDLDCAEHTYPHCPMGCQIDCPVLGCDAQPCAYQGPNGSANAQVSNDCLGNSQHAQGYWKLTLTSVKESTAPGPAEGPAYVVHGTLDVSLISNGSSAQASFDF